MQIIQILKRIETSKKKKYNKNEPTTILIRKLTNFNNPNSSILKVNVIIQINKLINLQTSKQIETSQQK